MPIYISTQQKSRLFGGFGIHLRKIRERREKMPKTAMSAQTMVAPTGVEKSIEMMMPAKAQKTEMQAEQIITERKLRKSLMAERAGKIIRAEIRSEPTRFMARTMMRAVMTAMVRL
jgi:hypothetical protein